ncbi:MAG TPA: signal peptidase II [Myxococcota bacterium]|nr:signal peptidase II [Myxococcota bacterium]
MEEPAQAPGFAFVARHKYQWLIFMCIFGVLLDQATKIWAQLSLAEPYDVTEELIIDGESETIGKKVYYPIKVIEVIPGFLNLIYKENPAAAFSLTRSLPTWFRRPMLIAISVIAILFFLLWYARMRMHDGLLLMSFSFILAGALGNLADRIRLGYVIDFIDAHAGFLGYPYLHWPTFNIADCLIVVGALGVVFRTLKPAKTIEHNQRPI